MIIDMYLPYSQLPAIDRSLRDSAFPALHGFHDHARVTNLSYHMLDEAREAIRDTHAPPAWYED